MEVFDVTVPVRDGMLHYEGNPPIRIERVQSIEGGAPANVTRIDIGAHTGTHVDAPVHFLTAGAGAETIPLDRLLGPAVVVDATTVPEVLDAAALGALELPEHPERVLFKTRNSQLWEQPAFTRDFVRLTGDAAELLVARGVRLVGIDYLSIGDRDAHRVLLRAGVVPLEGLDLRRVPPGPYTLVCLPLPVVGSDGAPARALLVRGTLAF